MSSTIDDKNLLRQCINGSQQAQFELYGRYATAMYHVAYRIVAHREGAEDVLQDSFLKVFHQLHTLRNEITLSAWIKRIVVTTALNYLRSQKKMQFVDFQPTDEHLELPDGEEEAPWDARALHDAIQMLPDGCRVVFSLYAVEETPHKDIAQMLGITESTSKTQYMRAKKLLRKHLQTINTNNASAFNNYKDHGPF